MVNGGPLRPPSAAEAGVASTTSISLPQLPGRPETSRAGVEDRLPDASSSWETASLPRPALEHAGRGLGIAANQLPNPLRRAGLRRGIHMIAPALAAPARAAAPGGAPPGSTTRRAARTETTAPTAPTIPQSRNRRRESAWLGSTIGRFNDSSSAMRSTSTFHDSGSRITRFTTVLICFSVQSAIARRSSREGSRSSARTSAFQ